MGEGSTRGLGSVGVFGVGAVEFSGLGAGLLGSVGTDGA